MIKYIKSNGKQYPVKFGLNASFALCEMYGLNSPDEIQAMFNADLQKRLDEGKQTIEDIKLFIALAYVGLQEGHRKERLDFDLETEDVVDMIESDNTVLSQVMEVYISSQPKPEGVGKPKPRKK